MSTLLSKFTPQDIGAIVVIVGSVTALCLGIDDGTREILGVGVGWCFGRALAAVKTGNNTGAPSGTDKTA